MYELRQMSSTAGPLDEDPFGHGKWGATMSMSRSENSFSVTFLFSVLGLTLSLCLVGLPPKSVAAQDYVRAFNAAHLQ